MTNMHTQVLLWLMSGRSINPVQAQRHFGWLRLALRIHELREQGFNIVTIREPGARYARYVLQRKKRAA